MTNQPASPPAEEENAPVPAKKGGGATKVVLGIVAVVAVAMLAVLAVFVVRNVLSANDPAQDAKAGDCLTKLPEVEAGKETTVTDVKVVACDAAEARFAVVGRVDDVDAEQASVDAVCQAHPDTTMRFYAIPPGGKGYVLCLKPA